MKSYYNYSELKKELSNVNIDCSLEIDIFLRNQFMPIWKNSFDQSNSESLEFYVRTGWLDNQESILIAPNELNIFKHFLVPAIVALVDGGVTAILAAVANYIVINRNLVRLLTDAEAFIFLTIDANGREYTNYEVIQKEWLKWIECTKYERDTLIKYILNEFEDNGIIDKSDQGYRITKKYRTSQF